MLAEFVDEVPPMFENAAREAVVDWLSGNVSDRVIKFTKHIDVKSLLRLLNSSDLDDEDLEDAIRSPLPEEILPE